ncbi:MAG: DNA repair protein RadC [Bacteroidota bacterium]|nr:MAG: DNA repair protein RadC [Bacteroidota bacterium]
MDHLSIKQWALEDRPREKLLQNGPRVLSDAELIAILIGSGTRELSAVELARKILAITGNNLTDLGRLNVAELTRIKGIGQARAVSVVAALELGRRRRESEPSQREKITTSQQAYNVFGDLLKDLHHEEFWIACLNQANQLIEKSILSSGGISGTVIDVRMIMKKAVDLRAASLILCHNHPSGNIQYSQQDLQITQKVKEAAKYFDITLLDHLIVAGNKYFSFADEGLIV